VPAHVGIYVLAILLAVVQAYDILTRPLPLPQVVEVANRSVVAIACKSGAHMFITAGFVSSERGYVTTVAHGLPACRGKEGNIEVKFWDNPLTYKAKIVRYNKMVDVAILHIDHMPRIAPLRFATEEPRAGTHIIALGHPQMLFWSASDGIISADRWSEHPLLHIIQVSCPINFGNSGGPVINDKGQVVGITSFMINNPSLGFIIAGDFVKSVANGL